VRVFLECFRVSSTSSVTTTALWWETFLLAMGGTLYFRREHLALPTAMPWKKIQQISQLVALFPLPSPHAPTLGSIASRCSIKEPALLPRIREEHSIRASGGNQATSLPLKKIRKYRRCRFRKNSRWSRESNEMTSNL